MYCDKEELKEEIIQSQLDGKVTPRLATLIDSIFRGVLSKMAYNPFYADEANQNSWCSVLRSFDRLDPEQNCFSYLTQIAVRECFQLSMKNKKLYKNFTDCTLYELQDGGVDQGNY